MIVQRFVFLRTRLQLFVYVMDCIDCFIVKPSVNPREYWNVVKIVGVALS